MYTCQEQPEKDSAREWLIIDPEGEVVAVLDDFPQVEIALKVLNQTA